MKTYVSKWKYRQSDNRYAEKISHAKFLAAKNVWVAKGYPLAQTMLRNGFAVM